MGIFCAFTVGYGFIEMLFCFGGFRDDGKCGSLVFLWRLWGVRKSGVVFCGVVLGNWKAQKKIMWLSSSIG